jgi:hypothetical protein
MTPLTALFYALPLVGGALLVHLLWPNRRPSSMVFKAFLGAGLGLGLQSLLYFVYLLTFATGDGFLALEVTTVVALGALVLRKYKSIGPSARVGGLARPTPAQWALAAVAAVVFLVSLSSTATNSALRTPGSGKLVGVLLGRNGPPLPRGLPVAAGHEHHGRLGCPW